MELVLNEVFKAASYLLVSGIVYLAWKTTYDSTVKNGPIKSLMQGLLIVIVLAFIGSSSLGEPTCIDSEQDNRGSTCYEYADDGFDPTTEQRLATFAYYVTLLYVPVILGAFQGKDHYSKTSSEES